MNRFPSGTKGAQYVMPAIWLEPKEYGKIYSEINRIYDAQYKNKRFCMHASYGMDGNASIYWFENLGFNNYNIYAKTVNNQ